VVAVALLIALVAAVLAGAGCGSGDAAPQPGDELIGKSFPAVEGESLAKKNVAVPVDFAGAPLIVLVAPSKASQPDADKWLAALRPQKEVEFIEVPVLPSLLTRLMQNFINGKMRGGEPRDVWPRIIPVYADGDKLTEFFGERGDESTYVAVLDGDGVIRFFRVGPFSEALRDEVLEQYEALTRS
jgi:hypothetical protein